MANLSNYGSDVLSEVPHFETYQNDMDNQSVQVIQHFEQTPVDDYPDNEIASDSNIILYSQYLLETQQAAVQDTNSSVQQDSMILSVIEQMSAQMINHPQVFYDDTHKQALGYQNPFYLKKAQRIKPTLYDGSVIFRQHDVIPMTDEEETLMLEEVSRSKMLAKQNDPISIKQKINVSPINYVELNQLFKDFAKCFIPQQELSPKQAFWLQTSNPNTEQSDTSPVKIEATRELPKISLVNTSLKKLTYHLAKFDTVVKKRITPDAITEGSWGECSKLDIEPISHRLKNNRDAYKDYLKKTIENTDTIRGLVERARKQNPSEPLLDSACMFTKDVQELLVYVSKTCPSLTKPFDKLVAVTPLNKKKV
ncbi:hypothetical protein Tco_0929464, partial [Tanacetum coccineum]